MTLIQPNASSLILKRRRRRWRRGWWRRLIGGGWCKALIGSRQFDLEPFFRASPIALDASGRATDRLGDLLNPQADEETEHDDVVKQWIGLLELSEHFIQREQIGIGVVARREGHIQRDSLAIAAAFQGVALTSLIDEQASHGLSDGREEMSPALPLRLRGREDAQEGFVNEGSGLHHPAGVLESHLRMSKATKVVVQALEHLLGVINAREIALWLIGSGLILLSRHGGSLFQLCEGRI
jgi:hypothetical protein